MMDGIKTTTELARSLPYGTIGPASRLTNRFRLFSTMSARAKASRGYCKYLNLNPNNMWSFQCEYLSIQHRKGVGAFFYNSQYPDVTNNSCTPAGSRVNDKAHVSLREYDLIPIIFESYEDVLKAKEWQWLPILTIRRTIILR